MTNEEYKAQFEKLPIWDRAAMHEDWKRELYAIANGNECAMVHDRNTCCPCVVFEADGFRAVGYLHSDSYRPAMYLGKEYMSIDYHVMIEVLKGYFGN